MKKIFALLFALIFVLTCLCSCGNMSMGIGNFTFRHIHVSDYNEGHCFEVEKWYDNSTGIEVRTTDGAGIFCSEGSYMMFENKSDCPYCNGEQ